MTRSSASLVSNYLFVLVLLDLIVPSNGQCSSATPDLGQGVPGTQWQNIWDGDKWTNGGGFVAPTTTQNSRASRGLYGTASDHENILLYKDLTLQDGGTTLIQGTIMPASTDAVSGLVLGYSAPASTYICYVTNGDVPYCNGNWGSTDQSRIIVSKLSFFPCTGQYRVANVTAPYPSTQGYTAMKFMRMDSQFTCILDSDGNGFDDADPQVSWTDPSPLPFAETRAGLYNFGDTAFFQDISVSTGPDCTEDGAAKGLTSDQKAIAAIASVVGGVGLISIVVGVVCFVRWRRNKRSGMHSVRFDNSPVMPKSSERTSDPVNLALGQHSSIKALPSVPKGQENYNNIGARAANSPRNKALIGNASIVPMGPSNVPSVPSPSSSISPRPMVPSNPSYRGGPGPELTTNFERRAVIPPMGNMTLPIVTSNVDNKFKIFTKDIDLIEKVGEGAYGVVWKAKWHAMTVAVKQVKGVNIEERLMQEFLQEAEIMKSLPPHCNVVAFIGVSVETPICILTEFMVGGSLKTLLDRQTNFDFMRKVQIMKDVAAGMIHISMQKIVHKDLAARNVLLTENMVAKVSDFGLSRISNGSNANNTVFSVTEIGPIKWMAMESLKEKVFSTKSDVYSYAVTCVEILTEAEPYHDVPMMEFTMKIFSEKYELSKYIPSTTPKILKDLLTSCLNLKPAKRPTFEEIYTTLEIIKP
eukprot:TRINITY_DN9111_c0_g1_i1.p2 TRINITY_DN9111_c0_g1~~TRINITY_DN9111_c0_g1_i1.p2  ORF type:complete len:698 (-),score=155.80 TRINITY_DN9111_c0_g1_i1:121-2214(-)